MCGIAGFIGYSKNYNLSFRLVTQLFAESEIRGIDAAGYWGTEEDAGSIVYHKEPIKSSDFIKKSVWKDLIDGINLNMLLVHARGASTGVGAPRDNRNNHPFTSSCKSIGLVHNGRIPDIEYNALTKRYEVFSRCDSEVLLRIFEAGQHYKQEDCISFLENESEEHICNRLMGLRDIWSYIDKGHMAVAIGERVNDDLRQLFLFRNKHRSLWLVDMRKELGQIFFCSTPEIWSIAFHASGLHKVFKNRIKLVEMPTEELWMLSCSQDNPHVSKIKKYDITTTGRHVWNHEGEQIKIPQRPPVTDILTKLDEQEELIGTKKEKKYKNEGYANRYYGNGYTSNNGYNNSFDEDDYDTLVSNYENLTDGIDKLKDACDDIYKVLEDVIEALKEKQKEGRLTMQELQETHKQIETLELDLEGSIRLIKNYK
ncbi:MAG: hypothetical protein DWQ19_11570 [Crenarchaeota archaeon]|nr:MAG: hypothetical protein DWQ19_11570 [Thermoproteota archaeon]